MTPTSRRDILPWHGAIGLPTVPSSITSLVFVRAKLYLHCCTCSHLWRVGVKAARSIHICICEKTPKRKGIGDCEEVKIRSIYASLLNFSKTRKGCLLNDHSGQNELMTHQLHIPCLPHRSIGHQLECHPTSSLARLWRMSTTSSS